MIEDSLIRAFYCDNLQYITQSENVLKNLKRRTTIIEEFGDD